MLGSFSFGVSHSHSTKEQKIEFKGYNHETLKKGEIIFQL